MELIGFSGCTDNEYAARLIISMIRHPNIGAVLAIELNEMLENRAVDEKVRRVLEILYLLKL